MIRAVRYFSSTAKNTCLRELHDSLKGKIVDFAGILLLIQDTISQSTTQPISPKNTCTAEQTHPSLMLAIWDSFSSPDPIEWNSFREQLLEIQSVNPKLESLSATSQCF